MQREFIPLQGFVQKNLIDWLKYGIPEYHGGTTDLQYFRDIFGCEADVECERLMSLIDFRSYTKIYTFISLYIDSSSTWSNDAQL